MKKILGIFLCTLMVACLFTGCNDDKKNGEDVYSNPPTSDNLPDNIDDLGPNAGAAATNDKTPKVDVTSLDNTKQGWGQGTEKNASGVPTSCLDFNAKYGKYNAVFVEKEEKVIYLTFDQGYENGYTAKILDTLKEQNTPATFFLTYDYVKTEADLITRMINEGHTIGNHSTKHKSFPSMGIDAAKEDITYLHGLIKDQFGVDMTLFRYPMGEFSEQSLAVINDFGYKSVFWSFAYKDWLTDAQPDPATSLQKLKDSLHPGAIYLLHSVSSTNAQILGEFITYAKEQGYTFAVPA